MDMLATIFGALVCGAAYIFGHKAGHKAGVIEIKEVVSRSVFRVAFANPGITDKRINELADSLIKSEGDMHEQAVAHIRRAAQEAVGMVEPA